MRSLVLFACLLGVCPGADKTLDFYIVDAGQGNATIVVTPSGQTMLFDAAPRRMAGRVLGVLKEAGVEQIDYLVVSHYHEDHMGGVAEFSGSRPEPGGRPKRGVVEGAEGGAKEYSSAEQFIANIGPADTRALYIEVSARPDGSFQ